MTSEAGGGPAASRRVLIVEDDTLVGIALKGHLDKLGHSVVAQAGSAIEAVTKFHECTPDLVLLDIRLGEADGIELAHELGRRRRVPMIVVTAFSDKDLIDRAGLAGVYGYLIKPVSMEALSAQIEVAVRRFEENERLIRQNVELLQQLENRKLVERAKGIFMRRLSLDEPEAHRRLQMESQKRRLSLPDLARKIIESEELLGGV